MKLKTIFQVSRKELISIFSSPVAFVFVGTFLAAVLFSFFWVERFFARNIADVRPLFQWLPLLLIFLVAAITMRMWSEERRTGTVEFLLTLPVKVSELMLGKLLACVALVCLALLLTLPIPLSVSFLGDLDWGPVIGGYVATILLATSYASIGLWMSSRSESQIVSLISTVILCLALYIMGSDSLTAFFGNSGAELLSLLSPSTRFESITRGVLDIRDMYYYFSLIGFFVSLGVYSLERMRWQGAHKPSRDIKQPSRSRAWLSVTLLLCVNFVFANFWLHPLRGARLDLTADQSFTISDATKTYLNQLSEPLLIRGYFSSRTHPLLAPLVPQIRDLIEEYAIASSGKVRIEFVDPKDNEQLEEAANQKYGIRPLPFQIADRYQASVVSSYFDILIEYGDKFEVLGFRDLIEVKAANENDVDVRLRNPEYDLTKAIKKVLYGFQGIDHLFQGLKTPLEFKGYISSDAALPEPLKEFRAIVEEELQSIKERAGEKLVINFVEPDERVAGEIHEKYGFQPLVANLLNPQPFYFYMLVENPGTEETETLPIPSDLTRESFRRSLNSTFQRFAPGFLKKIGLIVPPTPASNPMMRQLGMEDAGRTYGLLRAKLSETSNLQELPLDVGVIPGDIDILLVLGPKTLSEKDVFAIDQFLMRGGTVVVLTSPYDITRNAASLSAKPTVSGLEEWLKRIGITIDESFVLDTSNDINAIPVTRTTRSGFSINEVAVVKYPYFVVVHDQGLTGDESLLGGLPSVTMNWPSPILLNDDKVNGVSISPILLSSPDSWISTSTSINISPEIALRPTGDVGPRTLAVLAEGSFQSYFSGKEHPLLKADSSEPDEENSEQNNAEVSSNSIASLIERSTGSARVFVYSSADFVADSTLQLAAGLGATNFVNSLQIIEDTVDWSLEDRSLLGIRGRGQFARTLKPMEAEFQQSFEYVQYLIAFLGLLGLFALAKLSDRARRNKYISLGYKGVE